MPVYSPVHIPEVASVFNSQKEHGFSYEIVKNGVNAESTPNANGVKKELTRMQCGVRSSVVTFTTTSSSIPVASEAVVETEHVQF